MNIQLLNWPVIIRVVVYGSLAILVGIKSVQALRFQDPFLGFDVSNSLVPTNEIHRGGPPRDGIPAIDDPDFNDHSLAAIADEMSPVLGLDWQGTVRAYPVAIMNWHEIVNDHHNNRPLLITYCPLCGTGMAFLPKTASGFGVSGLLYNSDMLLYDRETESLWSQLRMQAISGPRVGEKLHAIPLELTTWKDWRQRHPDTRVLSRETGYDRDYHSSPYQGYAKSDSLYFPVSHQNDLFHPKASVIGLILNNEARAWPIKELLKANTPLQEVFAGKSITIHLDRNSKRAWITDKNNQPLPATSAFWFAWHTFHPQGSVFTATSN